MKMKKSILYKVKENIPSAWQYYIFVNNTYMVIFDKEFMRSKHRDDLQIHLIDREDFEEDTFDLNRFDKKAIIKGVL
jgi:hypothetical protein